MRLVERLDTGEWGTTEADGMNVLAAQIQADTSYPLGAARFTSFDPVHPTREWDAGDWGHYKPRK